MPILHALDPSSIPRSRDARPGGHQLPYPSETRTTHGPDEDRRAPSNPGDALAATLFPTRSGWLEVVCVERTLRVGRTFGSADPRWRAQPLAAVPRALARRGHPVGGGLLLGAAPPTEVARASRALPPPCARPAQWVLWPDGALRWGTEPLPEPLTGPLAEDVRLQLGPWHVRVRRLGPEPLWLLDGRPTRAASAGVLLLTPAQRRVAERAAGGDSVEQVATHLGRGTETVRTHLRTAYRALGVSNRVELASALGTLPGGPLR